MSATGRGAERMKDDFYETPAWCVRRYLDFRSLTLPSTSRWLEPSAGQGAIIAAVNAWFDHEACDGPHWMALDINPGMRDGDGGARFYQTDFLDEKVTVAKKFDMCLSNPPYKLAREFIEKGLTLAHEVVFLLRLNFLESEDRHDLFRKHPCDVRVLPNRPSFRADGSTDATAYAWFEFGEGHGGHMSVLALTSKAERLADRVAA